MDIKTVPARTIISMSKQVTSSEVGPFCRQAFEMIETAILNAGLTIQHSPFAIWYELISDTNPGLVEVGWPVSELFDAPHLTFKEQPSQQVAYLRVTLDESESGMPERYGALYEWIGKQGLQPSGPPYENYLAKKQDLSPNDDYIEIQVPVR
jgi:effector-binding domain-containing protein